MNDKEFLNWIKERLIRVEDVNENIDYIMKLQTIIDNTHPEQISQPVKQEPSNSELTPYYKQMLHSVFDNQADKQLKLMTEMMLAGLMDQLNAKQYVAVKDILESEVKIEPMRDFIVEFITSNYEFTDQDILRIKNYTNSSVAQKFIDAQHKIIHAIQTNQEELVNAIFGTAMEKIEEVLDK